jgi:hypothetical protein
MDIMMSETYSNRLSSALKDPHPMVELAPPPNAHPVSAPHPIYPPFPDETPGKRPSVPSVLGHHSRPMTAETARRSRRESYNLIGSTFLITNDGRTLKLPMPSNSKADPLNWNRWKTGGALFSVALFSVVCLTAAQAASVVLDDIQRDFAHEVRSILLTGVSVADMLHLGYTCMATQSLSNSSYLIHGLRMLFVGAGIHWSGPPAYNVDRDTCRTARYAMGWRGRIIPFARRRSLLPWSRRGACVVPGK